MGNSENNDKLKPQVTRFYDAHSLSSQQLEQLKRVGKKQATSRFVLPRSLSAIAALVLVVVSVWFVIAGESEYKAISAEIAYNHNSQMQMEVLSDSFTDIQTYLNRLDFSLVPSQSLPRSDWQLIGARYCSIGGKIAAQLKIKEVNSQHVYTLYQAKLPTKLADKLENKQFYIDGVNVRLWQENGLLMGLAK